MPNKKLERGVKKDESGIAIPAGLFIGMGIGFLVNNLVPWLFIGLGFGFLVMVFLQTLSKNKR